MKRIGILSIFLILFLCSCGDLNTQNESSSSASLDSGSSATTSAETSSKESSSSEESSSSSEAINGMVSKEVWEGQINGLGCLDGNYEISTTMIVGGWSYLCVFQHTNDSYHYVERTIEYVGDYALPEGEYNDYFYEEYLFVKDNKYLMYYRDEERYGFIKYYSDEEYDLFDKTTFCSIPCIFFRQLSYDDVMWSDDHYEATEMHESIDYVSRVYEYDSIEIKIGFDEYDRVLTFEYKTTIKTYENDALKETSNYIINGSFTGHDNVVLTEPQNILLDRT